MGLRKFIDDIPENESRRCRLSRLAAEHPEYYAEVAELVRDGYSAAKIARALREHGIDTVGNTSIARHFRGDCKCGVK